MKEKIILSLLIFVFIIGIFVPNISYGYYDYEIDTYNIDMVVNENNTFDITETIVANFSKYKHGIYRKIPLNNTVSRLDGTESRNRAKITNIKVSEKRKIYNKNGYKVIKIGDANEQVKGVKKYTIKYTYNIGKDPLKNADELYFNLIGTEWDTGINKVNFTIKMPKSFDKTKLGFSKGYIGSTDSSNISYEVSGNVIKGSLNNYLSPGKALTVRLALPEGYFVGASNNFDFVMMAQIIISIIFVIMGFRLWKKYGKDEEVVKTVEFYPPDGLNSAEIGFLYKGHSNKQDVISLLIYLANKGYLKIEEYEKTTLKIVKTQEFRIRKIKDYDGNNEDERTFFNDLFKEKDEVTRDDLYNKFYLTLNKISGNINRIENKEKVFEEESLSKRMPIVGMIIVIFLFVCNSFLFGSEIFGAMVLTFFMLVIPIFFIYSNPTKLTTIFSGIVIIFLYLICTAENIMYTSELIKFIIGSICTIALIVFLAIMKKRTQYGKEMLGKIEGFKNFLEIAEKPKLEELVMEDPEYFYNILPYTYVLGISDKWMKKFEDIALEAPTWYGGHSSFNMYTFNRFMNSTYSSISNAMMCNSSSSSSSGGGSSGGGSGGGGGGSW